MPRPQKIWFWKARQEWCVKIAKVRHRLGPDKEAAELKFHQLKANPETPVDPQSVAAIIDQFLDWTKTHRAPGTYDWYHDHLQSFLDSLKPNTLTVGRLKKLHVTAWLDGQPGWGDTVRRGAMTAVARMLNWAAKEDHIAKNPLQNKFEKPPAANRDQVISPEEYRDILKHVSGGFRDLVVTAWETGCRPQEVTRVEARHVDLKGSRWVFPVKESKGKKSQRIVYLTNAALAITKRLMLKHPDGPLFRNRNGESWTSFAVSCNFLRLQAEMGRQDQEIDIPVQKINARMREIAKRRKAKGKPPLKECDVRFQAKKALVDAAARKNAPKYCLYAFRHSYCTNGLKNGTDPVTMGKLMGHADLTMIYKIYNHITQDPAFMLSAARKVAK